MALLNIECKGCHKIFDAEVGVVTFSEKDNSPIFEKNPICTKCGERTTTDIYLTEIGQGQMTEIYFSSSI
jgi:hypothetical protein